MAKQQGGLAYLISLLVGILVLVAPVQYSQDIHSVVQKAVSMVGLVEKQAPAEPKAAEPAPQPQPAPAPTAPAAAPTPQPAPAPAAQPAPAAPAPAAQPGPPPAKPEPPKPAPAAQPAPPATPAPPAKAPEPPKPQPAPDKKPEPPKEQPKGDARQDGGGISLPLAQQAPPAPAPAAAPAAPEPSPAPAEGKGFIARLVDKVPHANFTLADALIWIIFVLWIIKVLVYRELKLVRLFPLAIVVFLVWGVLSMIPKLKAVGLDVDSQAALTELIQYIEYFAVGYLVIANNADTERAFKRVVRILILASTVVIAIGMLQYLSVMKPAQDVMDKLGPLSARVKALAEAPTAMDIKSTFRNRNTFGAFLAVMVPFFWGIALAHKRGFGLVTRAWMVILTLAGLVVTTSGGAMLAMVFAILAITFIRDEKFFVAVLAVGILAGVFLTKYLPRDNFEMLRDSVKLYKAKDAEPPRNYGWQQRYVEWQAGFNAMCAHPVFGVGIGNYQHSIDSFYGEIDKPSGKNCMEEDAVNGLFVLGATLGVPGLLAFLWILFKFQKLGSMGYSLLPRGLAKGVSLGIYGSMTSVLVASLFTNVLVRGVGVVLIILLALAGQVGSLMADAKEETEAAKG